MASTVKVTGTFKELPPAGVIVTVPVRVPAVLRLVVLIETGNSPGVAVLLGTVAASQLPPEVEAVNTVPGGVLNTEIFWGAGWVVSPIR